MKYGYIVKILVINFLKKGSKIRLNVLINIVMIALISMLFIPKSYGKPVDSLIVKKVAETFINNRFTGHQITYVSELTNSDQKTIGYVVNMKPSGFVVLSNDTDIYPIIYYSSEG